MYCEDFDELRDVYFNLQNDTLIGEQGVYIRQFEQFVSYGSQLNGMPIAHEFRFFVWNETILAGGYYWSNFPEVVEEHHPDYHEAIPFVQQIIDVVHPNARFYVIDVGQRTDGQWRVIELNDGQMAGLSCINADEFYKRLSEVTSV